MAGAGKTFSAVVVVSALALAAAVFAAARFGSYLSAPADPAGRTVVVDIPQGESFMATARILNKAGLLARPGWFRLYARLTGQDHRIKAGRYSLSTADSPARILAALVAGKGLLNRITVIEGWTVAEVARALEKGGFAKASDILALARDPGFARKLGIEAPGLEGYLFPDTYYFLKEATAEHILATLVRRFKEKFSPEMAERARRMGLSIQQVVILASMIEKETGDKAEYPVIASVFLNRLARNMRLQSDPTVIYGMVDFSGNLTRADLHRDSPYNTYTRKGLPAGPIANPGAGALYGALHPADTDYLYFVSRNDGTHRFSETLAQHNEAVERYQIDRSP